MKWAAGVLLAAGLGLCGYTEAQAAPNVQFSGRSVQSSPDGKSREARLSVGDNQVRLEHDTGGQDVVEIYDMKNQRVLFLVPAQKVYMQRDAPKGAGANPILPSKDSNPCTAMRDAECKKVRTESLYGRSVSKWEVTLKRQDKTLHSMHWIDDERHMSLRDVWPDGSTTVSTLEGTESLHGRSTERWSRTTKNKDGEEQTTTLWYDPELQIVVREELPGGFFREIRDIQVGPQAPGLFAVPAGYKRVDMENPAALQERKPKQPKVR